MSIKKINLGLISISFIGLIILFGLLGFNLMVEMLKFVFVGVVSKLPFGLLGVSLMIPLWIESWKKRNKSFFFIQMARIIFTAVILFFLIDVKNFELSSSNIFSVIVPFLSLIVLFDSVLFFLKNKPAKQKKRHTWEEKTEESKTNKPSKMYSIFSGLCSIALLVVWLFMFFIYPMTIMKELYGTVKVTTHSNTVDDSQKTKDPVEEIRKVEEMIIVTKELADEKSDASIKALKDTNSFREGNYTLTKFENRLVYSAPVEFDGFKKVLLAKETPGLTVVSATNPTAASEILYQPLVYTDSNLFDKDIVRIVRKSYPDKVIFGHYLQPVSDKESYYVFSVGTKKKYRSGDLVEGVVTVHPKTKEMKFYPLGKIPKWVNRAFTTETAMDAWKIWGTYKLGWKNQSVFGAKKDIVVPTDENLQEVIDENTGDILFVTDFVKAKDAGNSKSIVGYGTFNARTGEMIYYEYEQPVLTGYEALNKMNADEQLRLKGSVPFATFFTIFGEPTYVGPVMDKSNKFVGIAILYADSNNPSLAFGQNKEEAFRNYKRVIASLGKGNETNPSESSFLTQVEGIVTKINDANLESGYTFVIQIEGSKRHFLVNPNTFIDVVTTEKGERVKLEIIETEDNVVSVEKFTNLTVQ